MEAILNLVRREAARVLARSSGLVVGTVTSYDPATHTAKVQLQPEGTLTGWMPILSLAVGAGFGIQVAPHIGQACLVHPHDQNIEAGVILGFFFNDVETPISVQEGEIVIKHESGSGLSLLNDGSAVLTNKNGATTTLDASGDITMTGKAGQTIAMDASGNIILTPSGSGIVQVGGAGGLPAARSNDAVVSGRVVATSTKVTIV